MRIPIDFIETMETIAGESHVEPKQHLVSCAFPPCFYFLNTNIPKHLTFRLFVFAIILVSTYNDIQKLWKCFHCYVEAFRSIQLNYYGRLMGWSRINACCHRLRLQSLTKHLLAIIKKCRKLATFNQRI